MFALNHEGVAGYDPAQVDMFMGRVETQFREPQRNLVTSSMVTSVRFALVPGGYQVKAVDNTLAKLADTLETREISNRIRRGGKARLAAELRAATKAISEVLKVGAVESFSVERRGYRKSNVKSLIAAMAVVRGELISPAAFEVRTRELGRARSGFSRAEVDDFCSLVASATNKQNALS